MKKTAAGIISLVLTAVLLFGTVASATETDTANLQKTGVNAEGTQSDKGQTAEGEPGDETSGLAEQEPGGGGRKSDQ